MLKSKAVQWKYPWLRTFAVSSIAKRCQGACVSQAKNCSGLSSTYRQVNSFLTNGRDKFSLSITHLFAKYVMTTRPHMASAGVNYYYYYCYLSISWEVLHAPKVASSLLMTVKVKCLPIKLYGHTLNYMFAYLLTCTCIPGVLFFCLYRVMS